MLADPELIRLLLSRGWVRQEQLEPLWRVRQQGDPRPLRELLVVAHLVTPAQLQELELLSPPPATPLPLSGSSRPAAAGRPPAASGRSPRGSAAGRPPTLGEGQQLELRAGLTVTVERVLGQGGMGIVYLVRDPQLLRRAALKLIRSPTEARRLRFAREVSVTARLDHPGIPPVFEAGRTADDQDYLLMHYVAGESLAASLERTPPGPEGWRAGLEALVKVAEAVHYAHSRRVIHRDIKPDNVMLGGFGEVYLMDWGLARNLEESLSDDARARSELVGEPGSALLPEAPRLTRDGIIVGTPGYMAPEQARQEDVGPAADVFALGCLLSCVLTGKPPFAGHTPLELISDLERGALVLPRERDPRVPPELDAIAAAALQADRARRYPHAQALGQDLKAFLSGQPVSVHRYGRLQQTARLVRAHPTLFATLGIGFALSLLAVFAIGRAREAAVASERASAVAAAADEAGRAWADLAAVGSDDDRARRVGLALEALTTAQRWQALAPTDGAARLRRFEAALALGSEALADEQWAVSERAFRAATGLGVDDARAQAQLEEVQRRRQARRERALAEAGLLLAEAERGELERRPDGLVDATFRLARTGEPEVARLLAERLTAVARACDQLVRQTLLAARDPTPDEVAAGEGPLTGLEEALDRARARRPPSPAEDALLRQASARLLARHRAHGGSLTQATSILAEACARELPGQLRTARLCCEALGRLGMHGAPEEALVQYAFAEPDPLRVYPAALALQRLAGVGAAPILLALLDRHHTCLVLVDQLLALLPDQSVSMAANPDADQEEAAIQLLRANRYRDALPLFTRLLAQAPGRGELWAQTGVCRLGVRDLEGADRAFTRALELDDKNAEAWGMRGSTRLALGRLEEATEDQERAVKLAPGHAQLWFNLGNLRAQRHDPEGALAALSRCLELDPSIHRAWINRGSLRSDLGDLQGSESDLRRAIELAPREPAARINLGRTLREANRLRDAQAELDQAVALGPDRPNAWLNRGLVRLDLDDPTGAREDVTRALELDPGLVVAWEQRAMCNLRLGALEVARADAERATAMAPERVQSWNVLGAVTMAQGDLERARTAAARGRAIDPQQHFVLALEGFLAATEGDLERGRRCLREAVRREPRDVESWLLLSDALTDPSDSGPVLACLAEARRAVADVRFDLAECYVHLGAGRLERIPELIERVLTGSPPDTPTWTAALALRGWGRAWRGDAKGAREDLSEALRRNPYQTQVWLNCLGGHLTLGDDEAARRDAAQLEGKLLAWNRYPLGVALLALDLEQAAVHLRRAQGHRGSTAAALLLHALGEPGIDLGPLCDESSPVGPCARWLRDGSSPPPDTLSLLCQGLRAERTGDLAQARAAYRALDSGDLLMQLVARRRLARLER